MLACFRIVLIKKAVEFSAVHYLQRFVDFASNISLKLGLVADEKVVFLIERKHALN
jgi:hypothetical protein